MPLLLMFLRPEQVRGQVQSLGRKAHRAQGRGKRGEDICWTMIKLITHVPYRHIVHFLIHET